jgi:hypothetical protein
MPTKTESPHHAPNCEGVRIRRLAPGSEFAQCENCRVVFELARGVLRSPKAARQAERFQVGN